MNVRGYSLVEVMVVLGIITLLMGIGTLDFRGYLLRYRGEAQIRMIYGEILKARSDAICQRREVLVKVYPARFEIYSSGYDKNGTAPARTLPLPIRVSCTGSDSDGACPIGFDSRGITSDLCTIYLPAPAGSSTVDSVVVSYARVRLSKKE
jgi:prepilin-type N-terminal cleavage/methylation domain-containing protein